jgi:hypothetical protein
MMKDETPHEKHPTSIADQALAMLSGEARIRLEQEIAKQKEVALQQLLKQIGENK